MSQICPQCGNDIYATSAEHVCSDFAMPTGQPKSSKPMVMVDPTELATLRQKLAEAEADCAAMRESLECCERNDKTPEYAYAGEDSKRRDGVQCERRWMRWQTPREIANAALTGRSTGQALLDELSAARKVCEVAQWQENGGMWPENYADALDAYRAARKANT